MKIRIFFLLCVAFAGGFLANCASTDPEGSDPEIGLLPVVYGEADGCSISTDQPSTAAHGTVRLMASDLNRVVYSDLRSGRSLTIAELIARLTQVFGQAEGAAAGAELGKIGDLRHGGEAAFVADGNGGLSIVYRGRSRGTTAYPSSQVRTFKQLLDQVQS